jgi:hypothetical protein
MDLACLLQRRDELKRSIEQRSAPFDREDEGEEDEEDQDA